MNRYGKIAIEAALKSGILIKRSVGNPGKVSFKGRNNMVTETDKKAEKMIIAHILSEFPGHSILSEESDPINSASDYKWIVDPLDGTTNFAHAFPFFCVSIALERKGDVVMGVVYDPSRDELFYAEKGRGAFLNRMRIHVSGIKTLSESFLATGFAYAGKKKVENVKNFKKFLLRTLAIRRAGSAALDMCYVACARFDGFWEMDLKPWDCAAGLLIVKEAGGFVTKFDGTKFLPYDKDVLATNRLINQEMVAILSSK